jgi:hypothetical protein
VGRLPSFSSRREEGPTQSEIWVVIWETTCFFLNSTCDLPPRGGLNKKEKWKFAYSWVFLSE